MSEEAKERAWKEFDANRPKGSAPVDWNRGYQCGVETGFKGGYDAATADLKTQPTCVTAERDALKALVTAFTRRYGPHMGQAFQADIDRAVQAANDYDLAAHQEGRDD